ncbi:MAG TPA: hypothetical protein VFS40_16580 [Gemmatimonadales bacterium]|nr:hypothetical protein [Gemmatimonadales bacterium]
MSTLRPYRLVHYPVAGECLLKVVHLSWHWDWRYGLDPALECRRAAEANQTLEARAAAIVDSINAEVETATTAINRRPHLLAPTDRLGPADRDRIRRDLLTVQVGLAMLGALAAKVALERYRGNG